MTINLFFLTISFNKRSKSVEEYQEDVRIEQLYHQMKERQTVVMNRMF